MTKYIITEPTTESDLEKYYTLRFEILRKPWNQTKASTKDEWEKDSVHVLILNENEEAIAVGRLQLNNAENGEGQIRSMAVRTDMQGKGLGSEIMKYIEQKATEKKLHHIVLDAREKAVRFYENHGYSVIGDSYLLFGEIRHFRMKKILLEKV